MDGKDDLSNTHQLVAIMGLLGHQSSSVRKGRIKGFPNTKDKLKKEVDGVIRKETKQKKRCQAFG